MPTTKLPEKYRQARNVHEGYEIRINGTEGRESVWCPVTSVLHISAPIAVSTFTVTYDGEPTPFNIAPGVQVMSRRPAAEVS